MEFTHKKFADYPPLKVSDWSNCVPASPGVHSGPVREPERKFRMKRRVWILLASILVVTVVVFVAPAIPQSEAYHNFADKRPLLGIPNCLNVISNGLFLIVGLLGLRFVSRSATGKGSRFIHSGESWS